MDIFSYFCDIFSCDTPTPPEPRLSSEEFANGLAEVTRKVSEEKERARFKIKKCARIKPRKKNTVVAFFMALGNHAGADYESIISQVDQNKTFARMLVKYVQERYDGKASLCYQTAGVSRQVYSQIISKPKKTVTKRTALQLCIGLKLNKAEAEDFLRCAGYSFSPSSFADMTFLWFIEHGKYSIYDINEFLIRTGEEPIFQGVARKSKRKSATLNASL